jgi:Membrane bound beta barrel domain (DUF5777)
MKIRSKVVWGVCLVLALLSAPAAALAQTPAPPPTPPQTSDPDSRLDPLQPDFTLAALPTTLRMPQHKSGFRVTHRFTRALGDGDFSDLVSNFFGFDSGARIGLEFRYGLLPGTQIGVLRTSDRSIQISGQQSVLKEQANGHPISLDVIATLEGANNMRDAKSSAIGVLVSKKVAKIAALYVEPLFVVNSNLADLADDPDNNTAMIGLGARVRIRPAVYLVGEITPRVSGYRPGVDQMSFAIEARSGGHTFQINFSNGFGTTLGQLTRSGVTNDSWFIGFNISRKFF